MKRTFTIKLMILFVVLQIPLSLKADWSPVNAGFPSGNIFAKHLAVASSYIYATLYSDGLYISSNQGASWTKRIPGTYAPCTAVGVNTDGSLLFAGFVTSSLPNTLYKSTNNGISWTGLSGGWTLPTNSPGAILIDGSDIYVGMVGAMYQGGIWKSSNGGTSWTKLSPVFSDITCLYKLNNAIYAGTDYTLYKTTNGGVNWIDASMGMPPQVYSLASSNSIIYASTYQGLYKSTNNGVSWLNLPLSISSSCILASGNNIIASGITTGNNPGVIKSADGGTTWGQIIQGFVNPVNVNDIIISGDYIYAAVYVNSSNYGGVYKRLKSEVININKISSEIPDAFRLSQNYPNPFNPTTKIKFAVPKSSFVKINVYDILGREVNQLVNEQLQAGTYETDFNASELASGVYFYRLQTDGFSEVKKMTLIK